jgi:hypothetical protein
MPQRWSSTRMSKQWAPKRKPCGIGRLNTAPTPVIIRNYRGAISKFPAVASVTDTFRGVVEALCHSFGMPAVWSWSSRTTTLYCPGAIPGPVGGPGISNSALGGLAVGVGYNPTLVVAKLDHDWFRKVAWQHQSSTHAQLRRYFAWATTSTPCKKHPYQTPSGNPYQSVHSSFDSPV